MANVILQVPDMSCGHCKQTITNTLQDRPGVNTVTVDLPSKTVYLDYDERVLTLQEVSEALDDEGYPVAQIR